MNFEIATPRQAGARNDNPTLLGTFPFLSLRGASFPCHCEEQSDEAISFCTYLSLRGTTVPKQSRGVGVGTGDCHASLAMTKDVWGFGFDIWICLGFGFWNLAVPCLAILLSCRRAFPLLCGRCRNQARFCQ